MRTPRMGALALGVACFGAVTAGCSSGALVEPGADAGGTADAGGSAGGGGNAGNRGAAGSADGSAVADAGPVDGGGASIGGGGALADAGRLFIIPACPQETFPPPTLAAGCTQCLTANENPKYDGCCNISGDEVGFALCEIASACIRAKNCNVLGDVTSCYCGTNAADCDNEPNGPCVAEMTAAAGRDVEMMVTDAPPPAWVLARFGDSRYALGRADNIQNVAGLYCPSECGFPEQP